MVGTRKRYHFLKREFGRSPVWYDCFIDKDVMPRRVHLLEFQNCSQFVSSLESLDRTFNHEIVATGLNVRHNFQKSLPLSRRAIEVDERSFGDRIIKFA